MSSAEIWLPDRLWKPQELMQKIKCGDLISAVAGLSNFSRGDVGRLGKIVMEEQYVYLTDRIDLICSEVERLELNYSLIPARELYSIIHNEVEDFDGEVEDFPNKKWKLFPILAMGRYQNYISDLTTRLRDELKGRLVFTIAARRAEYLERSPPLFGDEVFNAFPSANDDIAEAGACLALGRSTACVMHLMRAAEVGLSTLANTLGVGKKNDWGSYLREIEKELVTRAKTSGARSPDEQFYSEAATSFDHLKRAWRNPTMHVDRSYSVDRAEEIFQAVGSFMRHLAAQISEQQL